MVTYRPEKLSELVGVDKQIEQINGFLYDFQNNLTGHKNACLLFGYQGAGKTTLVGCIARHYNFPLIEINGSEVRTSKQLKETLTKYTSCSPRGIKNCIILIDEADGIFKTKDKKDSSSKNEGKSAIETLYSIIKKTRHPIFLTANDDYPLKPIHDIVIKVQFYKHTSKTIDTVLRRYTSDEDKIYRIIQNCEGDIRAAMNMLDSLSQKIFTKETIFEVVDNTMNGQVIDGDVDIDNEELLAWLEENAQYRLLGVSHLVTYQQLCNAGRLMRISSKHTRNILLTNCRLSSYFHINERMKTLPSSYVAKIRDTRQHIKTIKSLSNKLPLHTYRQFESELLPILRMLSKNLDWLKAIYYQYDLDINDVSLLLNVPKDDIAVTSFMECVKEENKIKKTEVHNQTQAFGVNTPKLRLSKVISG